MLRVLALTLCLFAPLSALAQTYTPKTIRIDAPPVVDAADALHVLALPSGQPLTKEQIESALQRLADTGLFSDIGYTVNSDALVIKLTPSASSQLQPVHFANFVWWQPAELESLLEARVPGFHGKLPLAGTLTDQVKAALISLLQAKGVDATIDTRQNGFAADSITLTISSPSILIDQVTLDPQLPSLTRSLKKFTDSLHNQDFDSGETARTIHDSVISIYQDAGYLDTSVTPPTVSAPHKDLLNYAVDLTAAIHPGDLYTIASVNLPPTPPVSAADLQKAANLTPGNPASAAALRLAESEISLLYTLDSYLDAKATAAVAKDPATHTVAYTFSITPGPIYHLASIDTSALTPQQQQDFARNFHVAPGALLDRQFQSSLHDAILHLHTTLNPGFVLNRNTHTVIVLLKPHTPSPPQ